jgi:hypothetical protein
MRTTMTMAFLSISRKVLSICRVPDSEAAGYDLHRSVMIRLQLHRSVMMSLQMMSLQRLQMI